MIKKFDVFGKIALNGKNRVNQVEINVRLDEDKFGRPALGIRGDVWNAKHTDVVFGGQCLDMIDEYKMQYNQELFDFLYDMWKKYHLNDLHVGTPEQEAAIKKWKTDDRFGYREACEYLESIGLYEVEYHGLEFNGMYKYGHGWLYQPIEQKDLDKLLEVMGLEKHD